MPIITMPDGTDVQFPDDMAPARIKQLISHKFPETLGVGETYDPSGEPEPFVGKLTSAAQGLVGSIKAVGGLLGKPAEWAQSVPGMPLPDYHPMAGKPLIQQLNPYRLVPETADLIMGQQQGKPGLGRGLGAAAVGAAGAMNSLGEDPLNLLPFGGRRIAAAVTPILGVGAVEGLQNAKAIYDKEGASYNFIKAMAEAGVGVSFALLVARQVAGGKSFDAAVEEAATQEFQQKNTAASTSGQAPVNPAAAAAPPPATTAPPIRPAQASGSYTPPAMEVTPPAPEPPPPPMPDPWRMEQAEQIPLFSDAPPILRPGQQLSIEGLENAMHLAPEEVPSPEGPPPLEQRTSTGPVIDEAGGQLGLDFGQDTVRKQEALDQMVSAFTQRGVPPEQAQAAASLMGVWGDNLWLRTGMDIWQKFVDQAFVASDPKTMGIDAPVKGLAWVSKGRALIAALHQPKVSTMVHEMVHVIEAFLPKEERAVLLKWAEAYKKGDRKILAAIVNDRAIDAEGVRSGRWDLPARELVARASERYLRTGQFPPGTPPSVQATLGRLSYWIKKIYQENQRLLPDLSPEVRGVFDNLTIRPEEARWFQETANEPRYNNVIPGDTPMDPVPRDDDGWSATDRKLRDAINRAMGAGQELDADVKTNVGEPNERVVGKFDKGARERDRLKLELMGWINAVNETRRQLRLGQESSRGKTYRKLEERLRAEGKIKPGDDQKSIDVLGAAMRRSGLSYGGGEEIAAKDPAQPKEKKARAAKTVEAPTQAAPPVGVTAGVAAAFKRPISLDRLDLGEKANWANLKSKHEQGQPLTDLEQKAVMKLWQKATQDPTPMDVENFGEAKVRLAQKAAKKRGVGVAPTRGEQISESFVSKVIRDRAGWTDAEREWFERTEAKHNAGEKLTPEEVRRGIDLVERADISQKIGQLVEKARKTSEEGGSIADIVKEIDKWNKERQRLELQSMEEFSKDPGPDDGGSDPTPADAGDNLPIYDLDQNANDIVEGRKKREPQGGIGRVIRMGLAGGPVTVAANALSLARMGAKEIVLSPVRAAHAKVEASVLRKLGFTKEAARLEKAAKLHASTVREVKQFAPSLKSVLQSIPDAFASLAGKPSTPTRLDKTLTSVEKVVGRRHTERSRVMSTAEMTPRNAPERLLGMGNILVDQFGHEMFLGALTDALMKEYKVKTPAELADLADNDPNIRRELHQFYMEGFSEAERATWNSPWTKSNLAGIAQRIGKVPGIGLLYQPFGKALWANAMANMLEANPVLFLASRRVRDSYQHKWKRLQLERAEAQPTPDDARIKKLKKEIYDLEETGVYGTEQIHSRAMLSTLLVGSAFAAWRLAKGDDGTEFDEAGLQFQNGKAKKALRMIAALGEDAPAALLGDWFGFEMLRAKDPNVKNPYEGEGEKLHALAILQKAIYGSRYQGIPPWMPVYDAWAKHKGLNTKFAQELLRRQASEFGRMVGTLGLIGGTARTVAEGQNPEERIARRADVPDKGDDTLTQVGKAFGRGVQSQIPGLRRSLPPAAKWTTGKPAERIDTVESLTGDLRTAEKLWSEKRYAEAVMSALPGMPRKELTPIDTFMRQFPLRISYGDVLPSSSPEPAYDLLMAEEFAKAVQKRRVLTIVGSPGFKSLPDESQVQFFREAMSNARSEAERNASARWKRQFGTLPEEGAQRFFDAEDRKRTHRQNLQRGLQPRRPMRPMPRPSPTPSPNRGEQP